MWQPAKIIFKGILTLLILGVGALIFLKSLDYYQPDFSKGYLIGKQDYFDGIFRIGLYGHILSAPLLLFIGTVQVFWRYERPYPLVHRWAGRVYVSLVLLVSGPATLIMAGYALGGWAGKLSFFLLGMVWMYVTFRAWNAIRRGKILAHKQFMTRSFLLTASAVNLRLLSFLFIRVFEWRGLEMYVTAAWLSWLPFLLAYEVYLRLKHGKWAWQQF